MSTFSGLSTALSSLNAQRAAMEITGQNIANVNTPGYTRQRADMTPVSAGQTASLFSQGAKIGNGVRITDISRLGDIFLDARVRTTTSSASYLTARAEVYERLESTINEPSDDGISAQLNKLWTSFQDLSNNPQTLATKQVVLENAKQVQQGIASGYSAVSTQWNQVRAEVEAHVTEVNTTATAVAELNGQIRQTLVSGGNPNELIDQRGQLLNSLSALAGSTVRFQDDGTADVYVGGNPLVQANASRTLTVAGATAITGATDAASAVKVVWDRPGNPAVSFDGGQIAGKLSALAPATDGGILTTAANHYNTIAESLADKVNALHNTPPLFDLGAGPYAATLSVAITNPADIQAGAVGAGDFDGSVADALSQLGIATDGPDALWQTAAIATGVAAKATADSATVAYAAQSTAEGLQIAATSVDTDEETVNLLSYQRAYQAAARVMTTVDEMLDQLINRTGVVGR